MDDTPNTTPTEGGEGEEKKEEGGAEGTTPEATPEA